jgi:hypothetical protein
MREKTTLEELRRKLAALTQAYRTIRDPYDLDTFLELAAGTRFYDADLDKPPSVKAVETLAKLGVPRWALTSRGIVSEIEHLLAVRRGKGLASINQARLLRDKGHPRPWSVKFTEVSAELYRLRRGL